MKREGERKNTRTRRSGGYECGKNGVAGVARTGAVGVMVSTTASGSSRMSLVKRMNMQNDQRLHQEVI